MSTKKFASQADLEEKHISWEKLSEKAWAYTAEGDPNTGPISAARIFKACTCCAASSAAASWWPRALPARR